MLLPQWHKTLNAFGLVLAIAPLTGCTGLTSGSTLFSAASDNASLSTGVSSGTSAASSTDTTAGNLQILASSNAFLRGNAPKLAFARVDLHVKGGDFVTVASDVASLDLSTVQSGSTASLAQVNVDAGTYDGLRVVYASVTHTLEEGTDVTLTFDQDARTDASSSPTASTSSDGTDQGAPPQPPREQQNEPPRGHPNEQPHGPFRHERVVRFHQDLVVTADAVTHVLLDYSEGGHEHGPLPRFEATNADSDGSIKGVASVVSGSGDSTSATPLANAVVMILRHGHPAGSALTDENGAYAVIGLEAGTYDVLAMADEQRPLRKSVVVTAAQSSTQDLSFANTTASAGDGDSAP